MSEQPPREVRERRSELDAGFARLSALESAHNRRSFFRGLSLGTLPLVAVLLLGAGLVTTNGGIDALFVGPNGNVGIGTSSPEVTLDVKGTAAVPDRVGVGTSSPSSALDVQGSAAVSGSFSANENVTLATAEESVVTIGPSDSPYKKVLQVDGKAYVTQDFFIQKAGGNVGFRFTTFEGGNFLESFGADGTGAEIKITGHDGQPTWMVLGPDQVNVNFNGQKACSTLKRVNSIGPGPGGVVTDTILVPNSWDFEHCFDFSSGVPGSIGYQLGCIFKDEFA
ncbi:MAG: hypothetical protein JJ956_10680 [Pseudomonadales bacterium]|nr:hypothetical protein [Pseudomonadales bacterium]